MAEQSLMCNYRNCKIPITDVACVTKCSHIFCKNHFIRGERADRRCYTCNTILDGDFDVKYNENLNTTGDLQSVMLNGYSLETIFEMVSRGIQFWEYQLNLKLKCYKLRAENMKSVLADKELATESMKLKINGYIKKQREQIDYLKHEVENLSASNTDLEKQLGVKNRQLLNMQARFEELRRNSMASIITHETEHMETDELEVVCSQQSAASKKRPSPATPKFVFVPTHTPKLASSATFFDSL